MESTYVIISYESSNSLGASTKQYLARIGRGDNATLGWTQNREEALVLERKIEALLALGVVKAIYKVPTAKMEAV